MAWMVWAGNSNVEHWLEVHVKASASSDCTTMRLSLSHRRITSNDLGWSYLDRTAHVVSVFKYFVFLSSKSDPVLAKATEWHKVCFQFQNQQKICPCNFRASSHSALQHCSHFSVEMKTLSTAVQTWAKKSWAAANFWSRISNFWWSGCKKSRIFESFLLVLVGMLPREHK